ncbi:undecaprenyl-phosphate alpha-N-acetylglucosaminyl 1-phosphate transferase (plasmid) [Aureibacter tunicatorum]|nr:undecaprenyl-phosphate alpha-N-acetylglucosaminyl 1-phosphate transferase [Aureibacter tunicatorum]
MRTLLHFLENQYVQYLGTGIVAFILCYVSIPVVITVSQMKQLHAVPNERSSHGKVVPNLGGVGIFIGLFISFLMFGPGPMERGISLFLAGILILFFIGIKDDILIIAPMKKLAAQVIAATLLVFGANLRIDSMFGIFGIYELPFIISYLLTVFTLIVITNAYNLIDGVDGLAASIGILIAGVFGWFFWINEYPNYVCLSIGLMASLLAFLRFNFSKERKIFMGDTGSLLVGFVLAVFVVKFLRIHSVEESNFHFNNPAIVAVILLLMPLYDTLRVFMVRVNQGRSPMSADKNHIHHFFLKKGFVHYQTTLMIFIMTVIAFLIMIPLTESMALPQAFWMMVGLFALYSLILKPRGKGFRRSKRRHMVWKARKMFKMK